MNKIIKQLNKELEREHVERERIALYKRLAIEEEEAPVWIYILAGVTVFSIMIAVAVILGLTFHVWKDAL